MWSLFKKIFHHLSGQGREQDHSALFPSDVDKLRKSALAAEELEGPGGPITAREAFELAEELVGSFDSEARLLSIESQGTVDEDGRATGWAFQFILPIRWGHAAFVYNNGEGEDKVEVRLTPFAAEGSAMDKMLQDGQGGFVEQQWKVELERETTLTHQFQDSSSVLRSLANEGKPVDFQHAILLKASTPRLGEARWELFESADSKKSLYKLPIE